MLQKQSEAFHTFLWYFFPSLEQNFIAYRSSKVSDCIFEIHQLWQSHFSRVYSNCCCICSFEPEIIKIGQSSYKTYSNNILNFQESTTILDSHKKVWKLIVCPSYIWYIGFRLIGFYGIWTIVGYLMPNALYSYIYIKYILFGLVRIYGISTIVGYLMPNLLYTYILNI